MSKYKKAGFLIALLVVPVFIFLFLKGFTTNHFDLPYFRPLMEGGQVKIGVDGDTLYRPVAGLLFKDNAVVVSEAELKDRYTVIGRVIDTVDAPSKMILTNLGRIYGLATSVPAVRIVTLTNVGGQVQSSLDSPRDGWRVWEGDVESVAAATRELDLGILDEQQTIPVNNRLVLVDKFGFIRGYYNGLQPAEIDRLMAEIKILEYSDSLNK
jgi:protein SCO1/2